MKYYLYHWVPDNLQGTTIYPLNTLKETHPEIYKEASSKYEGREELMDFKIPFLNCLWNDVIHMSAVPPLTIKEALFEAGRTKPLELEYFEIDPETLDPKNTIVYLYDHKNLSEYFGEKSFVAFDPNDLEKYSHLPDETKEYYKEMFSQHKKPLLYHRVPHILYKGSIDISNVKRITP